MPDAITQSVGVGIGGTEGRASLVSFRFCLLKINFEWNYILNVALKWDLEASEQALAICLTSPALPQTTFTSLTAGGASIIQLELQLPFVGCCNSAAAATAAAVIPIPRAVCVCAAFML